MDPKHWSVEDDPLHRDTAPMVPPSFWRGVSLGLAVEIAFVLFLVGMVWAAARLAKRWMP